MRPRSTSASLTLAVIGVTLLLVAGSNVVLAATVNRLTPNGPLALRILLVNALSYVFAAAGMHRLIFDDMTSELRAANQALEAAKAELHRLAITDPLTGCHNRRLFDEVIGRELHRQRRYGSPLSLVFLDVDQFKSINDRLGHEIGDRVLQDVAEFLRRQVRDTDYVFRWGGDEFVVLLSCSAAEAARKAGELKDRFAAEPRSADLPAGLGLSVGWVEIPAGTTDLVPLLREADAAMYRNKSALS